MGYNAGFVLVLCLFLGIPAILAAGMVLPAYFRMRELQRLYEVLKEAQQSDRPFAPEAIKELIKAQGPSRTKDIRKGVSCLALAAACGVAMMWSRQFTDNPQGITILILPLCVFGALGVAFVGLGLWRQPDRD